MNGKTVKKIRKAFNEKEVELCNQIFEYFNSLSFCERVKLAIKIIRRKL